MEQRKLELVEAWLRSVLESSHREVRDFQFVEVGEGHFRLSFIRGRAERDFPIPRIYIEGIADGTEGIRQKVMKQLLQLASK